MTQESSAHDAHMGQQPTPLSTADLAAPLTPSSPEAVQALMDQLRASVKLAQESSPTPTPTP